MKEPEESEISRLIKFISDSNIPPGRIQSLMDSGLLKDLLLTNLSSIDKEIFYQAISPRLIGYLPVDIKPEETIEKLIAAGNYGSKNSDINSRNFPKIKWQSDTANIIVVCFKRKISSEGALKELNKLGLKPAQLTHLLKIGIEHQNFQIYCPIVALGSTWKSSGGYLYVPYLFNNNGSRYIDLGFFGKEWNSACLFLALQK